MGGRASRDKGKRGERATANEIRAALPDLPIRRGWQSRAGSDDADVVGLPGYWVEVKHGAQPSPRAALAQAVADSEGKGLVPVAVIRDLRREPFAVMRWPDLLRLIAAGVRARGAGAVGDEGETE